MSDAPAAETAPWTDRWLLPGETVLWRGRPEPARRSGAGFGARRVRYALTDRRLLIGSERADLGPVSWYRDQLAAPRVTQNADGTADIGLDVDPWEAPSRFPERIPTRPILRSIAHPSLVMVLLTARPAAPAPVVTARIGTAPDATAHDTTAPDTAAPETKAPIATAPDPTSSAVLAAPPGAALPAVSGWAPWPGESVLWAGRPARHPWSFGRAERLGRLGTAGRLLAAVAVTAAMVAAPGPAALWPLVAAVVLDGGYVALGRPVWRRLRVTHSMYVITDQRVVCVWKLRRVVVTDATHRALRPPRMLADGSLLFQAAGAAPAAAVGGRYANSWRRLLHPAAAGEPPNFVGLADPQAVAGIAADARNGAFAVPAVNPWGFVGRP